MTHGRSADQHHERVVPLPPPRGNGSLPDQLTDVSQGEPPDTREAPSGSAADARHAPGERELLVKRDRLIERFTAMQLDLGGVYYEMAIRDHVRGDVLTRKAADMQRVDAELRHVEDVLERDHEPAGRCPACDAPHADGAAFCSQCGSDLAAGTAHRRQ